MSWDVRHVASEWMIRIGAHFYIPQRRAASAGASWRMSRGSPARSFSIPFVVSPELRAALKVGGRRRIAIVIVNARSAPSFSFDKVPFGPGALELLMQSISLPMDRYSTESIAALQDMITQWQLRVRLEADARRLGADARPGGE